MLRHKISVGKSVNNLHSNDFKYKSISLQEIDFIGNELYRNLYVTIECYNTLKEYNNIYNVLELKVFTQFDGQNHSSLDFVPMKVDRVSFDDYKIYGVVNDYFDLDLREIYIDAQDKLFLSFRDYHRFREVDEDFTITLVLDNNRVVHLACQYFDHFNLIAEVYDKELFKNIKKVNVVRVFRRSLLHTATMINFDLNEDSDKIDVFIKTTNVVDVNSFHNFFEKKKTEFISEFVDTEKDVYVPVIRKDGKYIEVDSISYNIHLLSRSGADWRLKSDALWNGVNNDLTFDKRMFDNETDTSKYSGMSDLLGLLGFTDADVKNQKSALKRTFLRVSVYDSDKPYSSQLLSYGSLYLDENELLSKFNRYYYDGSYNTFSEDLNDFYFKRGITTLSFPVEYANNNSKRLDSRFTVKNRYLSLESSEGMYMYLFKTFNTTLEEKKVSLRIELNHSKFGRTIPLMLPYDYKGDKHIKSFQEIVDDQRGGGYSLKEFDDFHNIRFVVKNDFENNRYVYHIDYDFYNLKEEDINDYVFNLYEGRVVNFQDTTRYENNINSTVSNYKLKYSSSIVDRDDYIRLFVPSVTYSVEQTSARSGDVITKKNVNDTSSVFNAEFPIEELFPVVTEENKLLDTNLNDYIWFKQVSDRYISYRLFHHYEKDEFKTVGVQIVFSIMNGRMEVVGYKTLLDLAGTKKLTIARVKSKTIIDKTPYVSEEKELVIGK